MLASKHISNTIALTIHQINYDVDDKVQVQFIGTENKQRKTWHKIYHNAKGDAYFIKYGTRQYINDFIRL